MIRGHEDLGIRSGQADQFFQIAIQAAEIVQAQRAQPQPVAIRLRGAQIGIEIGPGLMLDLVGAIEHDGHQRRLVLNQQLARHLEPEFLARQVIADPGRQIVAVHVLADLVLALEIPGQFLGVKTGNGLQARVESVRGHVAAQVLPGREAGDQAAAFQGRWRCHHREVERYYRALLAAGQTPERFTADIAEVIEGEEYLVLPVIDAHEVIDAVRAGIASGEQRSPGRRGQRVRGRAQRGAKARSHELAQEGHDYTLARPVTGQIVENVKSGAIQAKEQGASHEGLRERWFHGPARGLGAVRGR